MPFQTANMANLNGLSGSDDIKKEKDSENLAEALAGDAENNDEDAISENEEAQIEIEDDDKSDKTDDDEEEENADEKKKVKKREYIQFNGVSV